VLGLTGCSGEPFSRERVAVSGKVMLGDQYVDGATVVFVPLEPSDGPKATAFIEKGLFSLSEERGPLEGKHRVEIHPVGVDVADLSSGLAQGGTPQIFQTEIPVKYQEHSQIFTVEAVVDGENEYEFLLEKN
ncbi:MAG: hypothetical protein KDA65_18495, partial [Planctomycetaceae bacterium]|nr:hypothetical protein [Planctomycetaceae bacterium]